MAGADDANALILSVSADTSKALKEFEKLNKRLDSFNTDVVNKGKKTKAALDSAFGNPGKAFDKIFDSTRFKVFDSGAARVGVFGSALENLGVVGLGAAGAIAAVAVSLAEAKAAMTFADELSDTAERLHVTTDALQQYRYAVRLAGGEEAGADAALEAFGKTLGDAEAGFPKAIKGFQELFGKGFTAEDVKKLGGVEKGIVAVNAALQGLPTEQKDSVVERLGLVGAKELVEGLPENMRRFLDEAKAAGAVMDAGLLKRAAESNEQFVTLTKVIDIQLKSAFVDLIPVLTTLLGFVVQMARLVGDIVDGFRSIEHKRDQGLRDSIAGAQGVQATVLKTNGGKVPTTGAGKTAYDAAQLRIDQANAELAKREAAAQIPVTPPTKQVFDVGKGADKAAEQVKHFNAELARIQGEILAAADNDRHSWDERAGIERARLEAEIAAKDQSIKDQVTTKAISGPQGKILLAENARLATVERHELTAKQAQEQAELQLRLETELSDALASVSQAHADLAKSAAERAVYENEAAAAARKSARDQLAQRLATDKDLPKAQAAAELAAFDERSDLERKAREAKQADDIAAEKRSVDQATLDAQIDGLQIMGELARTQEERRAVQLRILDLEYQREKAELAGVIASKTASDADKKIAQAKLEALNAGLSGRRQDILNKTAGPVEGFFNSLPQTAQEANEAFQSLAVQGLADVNDGLVAMTFHTEKWGDVYKRVIQDVIGGLEKLALQQAEAWLLPQAASALAGLPGIGSLFGGHRAGGGPVMPGKVYEVNELGREFFAPSVPGRIIPHDQIGRAMGAGRGGGGDVYVTQPLSLDLRNAVMTPELVRGLMAYSRQQAYAAAGGAYLKGQRSQPLTAMQYEKLGTA